MKHLQIIFICLVCVLGANADSDKVFFRTRFARNQPARVQPVPAKRNIENANTVKTLSRRITAIALQMDYLLRNCLGQEKENILFAPINIIKTLSTVMLGAGGRTEQELYGFLGLLLGNPSFKRSKTMNFHPLMGKLLTQVIRESPGVSSTSLEIAGGIFVQSDFPVKQSYIDNAKNIYYSEVYSLNFADGYKSAVFINEWISNKTHGRIKSVLAPPVDPSTRLIVAGALYFNGDWEVPFPDANTDWRPFYLGSDGKYGKKSVLVEMMLNVGEILYYDNPQANYTALGIPYKNREVYMFLVLPYLNTTLSSLSCRLTADDLLDIANNKAMPKEAFYVIPKMQLESEINLRQVLQRFNVSSMFDPRTADFSNMANGVFASDILHKVEMEVNEIGTTAAAATVTHINRMGRLTFRADRPFLFFIYNRKVGILTFWGSIKKPTPNKPNDEV